MTPFVFLFFFFVFCENDHHFSSASPWTAKLSLASKLRQRLRLQDRRQSDHRILRLILNDPVSYSSLLSSMTDQRPPPLDTLAVRPENEYVTLWKDELCSSVLVEGDVIVCGDLFVEQKLVVIKSANLTVTDTEKDNFDENKNVVDQIILNPFSVSRCYKKFKSLSSILLNNKNENDDQNSSGIKCSIPHHLVIASSDVVISGSLTVLGSLVIGSLVVDAGSDVSVNVADFLRHPRELKSKTFVRPPFDEGNDNIKSSNADQFANRKMVKKTGNSDLPNSYFYENKNNDNEDFKLFSKKNFWRQRSPLRYLKRISQNEISENSYIDKKNENLLFENSNLNNFDVPISTSPFLPLITLPPSPFQVDELCSFGSDDMKLEKINNNNNLYQKESSSKLKMGSIQRAIVTPPNGFLNLLNGANLLSFGYSSIGSVKLESGASWISRCGHLIVGGVRQGDNKKRILMENNNLYYKYKNNLDKILNNNVPLRSLLFKDQNNNSSKLLLRGSIVLLKESLIVSTVPSGGPFESSPLSSSFSSDSLALSSGSTLIHLGLLTTRSVSQVTGASQIIAFGSLYTSVALVAQNSQLISANSIFCLDSLAVASSSSVSCLSSAVIENGLELFQSGFLNVNQNLTINGPVTMDSDSTLKVGEHLTVEDNLVVSNRSSVIIKRTFDLIGHLSIQNSVVSVLSHARVSGDVSVLDGSNCSIGGNFHGWGQQRCSDILIMDIVHGVTGEGAVSKNANSYESLIRYLFLSPSIFIQRKSEFNILGTGIFEDKKICQLINLNSVLLNVKEEIKKNPKIITTLPISDVSQRVDNALQLIFEFNSERQKLTENNSTSIYLSRAVVVDSSVLFFGQGVQFPSRNELLISADSELRIEEGYSILGSKCSISKFSSLSIRRGDIFRVDNLEVIDKSQFSGQGNSFVVVNGIDVKGGSQLKWNNKIDGGINQIQINDHLHIQDYSEIEFNTMWYSAPSTEPSSIDNKNSQHMSVVVLDHSLLSVGDSEIIWDFFGDRSKITEEVVENNQLMNFSSQIFKYENQINIKSKYVQICPYTMGSPSSLKTNRIQTGKVPLFHGDIIAAEQSDILIAPRTDFKKTEIMSESGSRIHILCVKDFTNRNRKSFDPNINKLYLNNNNNNNNIDNYEINNENDYYSLKMRRTGDAYLVVSSRFGGRLPLPSIYRIKVPAEYSSSHSYLEIAYGLESAKTKSEKRKSQWEILRVKNNLPLDEEGWRMNNRDIISAKYENNNNNIDEYIINNNKLPVSSEYFSGNEKQDSRKMRTENKKEENENSRHQKFISVKNSNNAILPARDDEPDWVKGTVSKISLKLNDDQQVEIIREDMPKEESIGLKTELINQKTIIENKNKNENRDRWDNIFENNPPEQNLGHRDDENINEIKSIKNNNLNNLVIQPISRPGNWEGMKPSNVLYASPNIDVEYSDLSEILFENNLNNNNSNINNNKNNIQISEIDQKSFWTSRFKTSENENQNDRSDLISSSNFKINSNVDNHESEINNNNNYDNSQINNINIDDNNVNNFNNNNNIKSKSSSNIISSRGLQRPPLNIGVLKEKLMRSRNQKKITSL